METMIWVYLTYLVVCVLVTILVARTLQHHGAVFIAGSEAKPTPLTNAKTHLLIVGFYLVCIGLISFALKISSVATDAKSGIEVVSSKVGAMVLFIGLMHFIMVWIFASIREGIKQPSPERIIQPNKTITIDEG